MRLTIKEAIGDGIFVSLYSIILLAFFMCSLWFMLYTFMGIRLLFIQSGLYEAADLYSLFFFFAFWFGIIFYYVRKKDLTNMEKRFSFVGKNLKQKMRKNDFWKPLVTKQKVKKK